MKPRLAVFFLTLWPATGVAHGPVHERIVALDARVRANPRDPELLVQRGLLYELDESWTDAIRDFESARALAASRPETDYFLARALLRVPDPTRALLVLERYLRSAPTRSDAWLVKARAHAALEQGSLAASSYDRAIELTSPPTPELFIERAQVLASMQPPQHDEALRGLREGSARLGPLVTFVEPAVAIEEERRHFSEAISWAERLPPTLRQSARWRLRVGELYARSGEPNRAAREWRAGLQALTQLPPSRARSEESRSLRTQLQAHLDALPRPAPVPSEQPRGVSLQFFLLFGLGLAAIFAWFLWSYSATRQTRRPPEASEQ